LVTVTLIDTDAPDLACAGAEMAFITNWAGASTVKGAVACDEPSSYLTKDYLLSLVRGLG